MLFYESNNLRKNITAAGIELPDVSEVADFNSVVEQLLLFHKGLHNKTRNDVVIYYQLYPSVQSRASFLQKEIYSKDVYCETSLLNSSHAGFRALDEGLEIWVGGNAYTSATGRSLLSWPFVAENTARLIQEGRYGAHGQVVAADAVFNECCEEVLRDLESPIAKAMEPTEEELSREAQMVKEYRVAVGNKVWLNGSEFEILSLNDKEVCLSDINFPLFTQDMPRDELVEQLAESPRNDYLAHLVETPAHPDRSDCAVKAEVDKPSLDSAIQSARQQTQESSGRGNGREDREI